MPSVHYDTSETVGGGEISQQGVRGEKSRKRKKKRQWSRSTTDRLYLLR